MAPAHMGIGHVLEHRRHDGSHHAELHRIEQQPDAARQTGDQPFGRGNGIRGHGHAQAEDQRPHGHRGPVNQHALAQRARGTHAPDGIERAVNRENHGQDAEHQYHQTGQTELVGFTGKQGQVAQHLACYVLGHQALHQPFLGNVLELAENRKRGDDRQHHGNHGHQRNRGRESEAAGRHAQTVLREALPQRDKGLAPAQMPQVAQPGPKSIDATHRAMMPPGSARHSARFRTARRSQNAAGVCQTPPPRPH